MPDKGERKKQYDKRMRMLNRVVLGGAAIFLPIYIGVRLTSGSAEKLENITSIFKNINNQVSLTVPADGVRYMYFFPDPVSAEEGHKFVVVDVNLEAYLKLAWSVVPRCFQLVDDEGRRYYPLERSPFFIEHTNEFKMDRDQVFTGQLLFEIPIERKHVSLLFDRYKQKEGVE